MAEIENFKGRVFGRWTVIGNPQRLKRQTKSLCRCVCGVERLVLHTGLKKGTSQSCGCFHREVVQKAAVKRNTKHGGSRDDTYQNYVNMKCRCLYTKHPEWDRYGGNGITVCGRWLDENIGYPNFLEDMGHRPTKEHTIDRIDRKKGYFKENCRWATKTQQSLNADRKPGASGCKGVSENRKLPGKPWTATITSNRTLFYLGAYKTKEEAALAYNFAADRLHGNEGTRNHITVTMDEVTVKRITAKVNFKIDERLTNAHNEKEENIP